MPRFGCLASLPKATEQPSIRTSEAASTPSFSATVERKRRVPSLPGTPQLEANVEQYDVIVNEFRSAKNSDQRNSALRSLGYAEDEKLISRTLRLALSDEVKDQDIYLPLGALRGHPGGTKALFQWMKDNWDTLHAKLPPGLSMLGSVVSICTSGFTKPEQMDDIRRFFKERSTKGFDQNLAQSLDVIKAKGAWVKRDGDDLEGWLKSNGYLSRGSTGEL